MSVFETVEPLEKVGLKVKDVIVLVDRQQGGKQNIESRNRNLYSVMTITDILTCLEKNGKISADVVKQTQEFLKNNQTGPKPKEKVLTYGERAKLATNKCSQKFLSLMDTKKTNLCLSADVTDAKTLLELADSVGPEICCLKTHIDILSDYTAKVSEDLVKLAKKHNFMIFEDRKFADIGNTMKHQFEGGVYKISEWADITNAHTISGPGVVDAYKMV
eukprot:UN06614